jgi:magnesium transporter
MLALYAIQHERLVSVDRAAASPADAVWIDLLNPTAEEDAEVEKLIGITIPTREEMKEIEISSRLYSENNALYMTASLLFRGDTPMPQSAPVTFILTHERLVTVRYSEPSVFRTFVHQAQKADSNLKNADTVLIALLEAIIDRIADILESVSVDMDAISSSVFATDQTEESIRGDYKDLLRRIGRSGDFTSKVRESLVSIGRLVNFLTAECGEQHPELRERTGPVSADIRSLTDHATYVSNTTVFLLDATVGLITIDQNNIIKIVSVVSVVIMPPTLIASIYGMNFRFMPELHWVVGYPLALVAMVGAAILPYWYFRRRGWL